ncbi:methyltransferase [Actinoplanes sp. NPDC049802]|uniref:methyltransferase n=1 Tax=Actinoplanes sp. NPDC049802 TaxID=3154742 RepID=UPI0033F1E721
MSISGLDTATTDRLRLRTALIERIGGYMTSHALAVVADLGFADLIKDEVRDSGELAAELGTHEPSLRRVLRLLAATGITTEPEPGRFGLTPVGALLRSDSPDSLRAFTRVFCSPMWLTAWQGLGSAVATGDLAFDRAKGSDFYTALAADPEFSALFHDAMSEESRVAAARVAAAYDFSGVSRVVDLGGGDGTLIAALLTAHPHLRGTVFDSPNGIADAAGVLEKAGVADRAEARPGDFFQDIPQDGDLYIIKSVFQDWNDEDALALLRSCRDRLPASATLLVVGTVLPETAHPDQAVAYFTDVNMMVMAGGRERTESEFREMLASTGFTVESVRIGAAGPLSMIRATLTGTR